MSPVTPIILAAGASTRMGSPKSLLDFGGRTALELVWSAAREHGIPIVVLGPDAAEIRRCVVLEPSVIVQNPDVQSGQTGSLKKALALLPETSEAFFFTPVDVPLVFSGDIARLIGAFREGRSPEASIYIPSHGMKRGHPVLCRRELAAEFLSLPEGAPARDVINRIPARVAYVEYPEAYVLMDMDTREDYVRCLGAYHDRLTRKL